MPQYKMHIVRVVAEYDAVVIVEGDNDPVAVGRENARDITMVDPDRTSVAYVKPIEAPEDIPKNWEDSLPWGDNPIDLTTTSWLDDEEYVKG